MRGTGAHRLITALEGEFAAAASADDDIAASDLAFSLAQDVPVWIDVIRRGGRIVLDDSTIPIEAVGHDFLVAGGRLLPMAHAIVTVGDAPPPNSIADVLVGALRRLARSRAEVVVRTAPPAKEVQGVLARCGSDHLVVSGPHVTAVPLSMIASVRRVPGGLADAP